MAKKNLGRRKIRMEKIQNPTHLNVTFSKRRAGLYKKAHELSTMCGAEVGLVCFSPSGKVFTYGSPNVTHLMNRFEHGASATLPISSAATEQTTQLEHVKSQLEVEKKKGEAMEKKRRETAGQNRHCLWKTDPTTLGLLELERLKYSMEVLKWRASNQVGGGGGGAIEFGPYGGGGAIEFGPRGPF